MGFRNAQATVLAPTGTISFMMDCDTTGIEPDIALVKYKQLAGGGMLKIINRTVPLALETWVKSRANRVRSAQYIDENDTIEGLRSLHDDHLSVFDCAFKPANGVRSIAWRAHVAMMAAAQPFLSGAISKTVNMPADSTADDIADAYRWGWELGLKALGDLPRRFEAKPAAVNTSAEGDKAAAKRIRLKPRRERLPDTRQSVTHKFNVTGHEGYITVGLYEDGRPGELFITMAKEGSTIGGLMDSFGTAISMSLQYGVPLEVLVNKFSHSRFEPMGYTTNPDIRIAKSVVDYIFRWLGIKFLPGYREATIGVSSAGSKSEVKKLGSPGRESASKDDSTAGKQISNSNGQSAIFARGSNGKSTSEILDLAGVKILETDGVETRDDQFARFQSDAPSCDNCGSITVRNGNCYLCHNCGNSMGCS